MERSLTENGTVCGYVVRGAVIQCSLGSHTDVLNVPKSHGAYIKNQVQLTVADCKAGTNILCFGACKQAGAPSPVQETIGGNPDPATPAEPAPFPVCAPVLNSQWINHHTTHLRLEGRTALLQDANLMCARGGEIKIIRNG
jgi:hypothetical protein